MSEKPVIYRLANGKVLSLSFARPMLLKPDPVPYRETCSFNRKKARPEPTDNVETLPVASKRFK